MSAQIKSSDDSIPQDCPYAWSQESSISLEVFLAKYNPSMVQNDGTKPWIWVRGKDSPEAEEAEMVAAINEASSQLKEVSERVEAIKNDAAIPMRSNKKTGAKSKKEVREQVQAEAAEKLKEISIKHGYVWGKWLIFAPPDRVHSIWTSIATSLVSGPLASTSAFLTKVSTSPESETSSYQHVICLYLPDVYDKESVTKVMKVLLRNHGVNLSGVKSDLYTAIGLDSKHPSGIPSTIWRNTTLLKDVEIKELKDAYFADLSSAKAAGAAPKTEEKEGSAEKSKRKPVLKKKAVADDPFRSDDDDDQAKEAERKQQVKDRKASMKPIKRAQESDSEEDEKPKAKKRKAVR